jgi:uncharacterized protein YgiB involved in biofilm formation
MFQPDAACGGRIRGHFMSNRRRSAYVGFSVMTLSAAGLAGCDRPDPPKVYSSVAECKAQHPGQACDDAWQASVGEHDQNAPHYNQLAQCEAQYGVGHCESHSGGFFMPMMAGFVLGQMINRSNCNYSNGGCGYGGGYIGHPVFFAPGGGYRAPTINPGESLYTRSGGITRGGFGATAAARGGFGHFGGGG